MPKQASEPQDKQYYYHQNQKKMNFIFQDTIPLYLLKNILYTTSKTSTKNYPHLLVFQKMLQKTAIAANTQANTANALQNIAEKNIALRANAYNAMLNAGAQSAQNRMKSTMYDTDVYMKSHAARQSGMQMGIYNFINALNQYTANEYKRRMGNAMIDLYSDDLRSRRV